MIFKSQQNKREREREISLSKRIKEKHLYPVQGPHVNLRTSHLSYPHSVQRNSVDSEH